MIAIDSTTQVLNFVVVGNVRSGTAVVQAAVNTRGQAFCHENLFHAVDDVRRACHESYFGPCRNPDRDKEWFVANFSNPIQYLNDTVFDHPLRGELAIGVRLLYATVKVHELYELFEQLRCREGDFCVVHVVRNPVACFVSQIQATRTNLWTRNPNEPMRPSVPMSVSIDPIELTTFCREHDAMQHRLNTVCADKLAVPYADLLVQFQATMYRIYDFLELPYSSAAPVPGRLRLRNRTMSERISNFAKLRTEVPYEVRCHLDAEDLY